jgi:sec-independent protein translocase protein TatC
VGILTVRRRKRTFARAADGSMSLMEHLYELRSRLFKASLAILIGICVGLYFAKPVLYFLTNPYCHLQKDPNNCRFITTGLADQFMLQLRIGLYLGLCGAAPVWLYQLWAFIAPGLHRNERRYTYAFVAIATPLFLSGVILAHFVVAKSIQFFLPQNQHFDITVGLPGYIDFVLSMMLLFGAGLEFPLLLLMLNVAGIVSARRLLSWWRPAVFLMFLFGAIVTPTPDPFGMSALAGAMSTLYFTAVGVAYLNDRRRGRKSLYAGLADDEISPLDYDGAGSEAERLEAVSGPLPLERRYDDST